MLRASSFSLPPGSQAEHRSGPACERRGVPQGPVIMYRRRKDCQGYRGLTVFKLACATHSGLPQSRDGVRRRCARGAPSRNPRLDAPPRRHRFAESDTAAKAVLPEPRSAKKGGAGQSAGNLAKRVRCHRRRRLHDGRGWLSVAARSVRLSFSGRGRDPIARSGVEGGDLGRGIRQG